MGTHAFSDAFPSAFTRAFSCFVDVTGASLSVPAHSAPSTRRNSFELTSPTLHVPVADFSTPLARRGSFGLLSVPGSPIGSPQLSPNFGPVAIPQQGLLPMKQVQAYMQPPTNINMNPPQMMQPAYCRSSV